MDERKWLELLALVETLGSVTLACKHLGVSRSLYYKWRRLNKPDPGNPPDTRPHRRIHPHAIPERVKLAILAIARFNPDWGCQRISYWLELKGIRVSAATVNKLLRKN